MSRDNFEFAFQYTLVDEGGYSNDPGDSGGPTKYGITQHDYAVFKKKSVSADDVKAMIVEEAKQIYLDKYWNALSLDAVDNKAIATCIFNMGVNFGIGIGAKFAQTCVGVSVDGHIGPQTIAALNKADPKRFVPQFVQLCKDRYASISRFKPWLWKFRTGWNNRANRLMTLLK